MFAERILSTFCRFDGETNVAAVRYKADPLKTFRQEFPGFADMVRGKRVLDYGCGAGHQAAAMAALGAKVTGLDTNLRTLAAARNAHPGVEFVSSVEGRHFDLIVSQDAMEHFGDPREVLLAMKTLLAPKGKILVTFGPPWYAPYGAHMHFFCSIPWVHLLFPERAIMKLRQKHPAVIDKAERYEDVESGLNKMSLWKWRELLDRCYLQAEYQRFTPVGGLSFLAKIPLVRELFVNNVSAILIPRYERLCC